MKTYLTLDVGGSAIKYALMQEDLITSCHQCSGSTSR